MGPRAIHARVPGRTAGENKSRSLARSEPELGVHHSVGCALARLRCTVSDGFWLFIGRNMLWVVWDWHTMVGDGQNIRHATELGDQAHDLEAWAVLLRWRPLICFARDFDERNLCQKHTALYDHRRVAGAGLSCNDRRADQPISDSGGSPPFRRYSLMRDRDQVTTRPRRDVAEDGGLDIDARLRAGGFL